MSSSESENDAEDIQDDASITHQKEESNKTFAELGLVDVLCEACEKVGWKHPSKIQAEAIPVALSGKM